MNGASSSSQSMNIPPELRQGYRDLSSIGRELYYDNPYASSDVYATRYAQPSTATRQAASALYSRGSAGTPLAEEAYGAVGDLIGSTPVAGIGGLEKIARGEDSITVPGANPYAAQIAAQAGDRTQRGTDLLEQSASGSLIGANPYLDATYKKAADAVTSSTMSALNNRGLAGNAPGIETNVLSKNLGDVATDIYGGAYETDMSRALSSGQTLAGIDQGDRSLALSGLSAAGGLAGQDIDRRLGVESANIGNRIGATQALSGLETDATNRTLASVGALPGISSYANQDIEQLLQSGALTDADNQARIDDRANAQEYARDRNWNRAAQYAQLLGIAGGQPVGSTTTTKDSTLNQFGTGAAGIAALATLFSDRRLKTDIEFDHEDDAGRRWYRFRYRWDPPGVVRRGVMADEVTASARRMSPSGFEMVDYGALMTA